MNVRKLVLAFLFVDFAAFTAWTIAEHGTGWIAAALATPASIQVAIDLCFSMVVASGWMWRDAKARGINPMPYLLAVPLTGSLSLLAYLYRREAWGDAPSAVAA